eukprot:g19072.t1
MPTRMDQPQRPQSAMGVRGAGPALLDTRAPVSFIEDKHDFSNLKNAQNAPVKPRPGSIKKTGGILGSTGIYAESQKPPLMMNEPMRQKYLTEQLHESKKEMHVMKQKQMKLAARHKQLQRAVLKRDKTLRQTQDANRSSLPVPVPLLESLMVAPAGN